MELWLFSRLLWGAGARISMEWATSLCAAWLARQMSQRHQQQRTPEGLQMMRIAVHKPSRVAAPTSLILSSLTLSWDLTSPCGTAAETRVTHLTLVAHTTLLDPDHCSGASYAVSSTGPTCRSAARNR